MALAAIRAVARKGGAARPWRAFALCALRRIAAKAAPTGSPARCRKIRTSSEGARHKSTANSDIAIEIDHAYVAAFACGRAVGRGGKYGGRAIRSAWQGDSAPITASSFQHMMPVTTCSQRALILPACAIFNSDFPAPLIDGTPGFTPASPSARPAGHCRWLWRPRRRVSRAGVRRRRVRR